MIYIVLQLNDLNKKKGFLAEPTSQTLLGTMFYVLLCILSYLSGLM